MGARRENCVLVVDENGVLSGIFTAKDLAYRVVAAGKTAAFVTVDQIMTKNPMCVSEDTPAADALSLMVQKGFRHLPILAADGSVYGVLDITRCYQETMEKLERMYESSKRLYDALDLVNHEMGAAQPALVVRYFENLQDLMGGPVLDLVLDLDTLPVYTSVRTLVYDAAVEMKAHKTTALLVRDPGANEVLGIFTSKDVVLRVVAAGLDPRTCSVVRVMTPQPDCAPALLTIHAALRKMFDGHYLNLPVVEQGDIIGIVEVLKLTQATLRQLRAVKSTDDESPVWNRFWTMEDASSVHLGSASRELALAEVHPNDLILCVNEEPGLETETSFAFKFRSPLGRVHRVSLRPHDGLPKLRLLIVEKLQPHEVKQLTYEEDYDGLDDSSEAGMQSFAILYKDDEGDLVAITTDQDLQECVAVYRSMKMTKADLYVHSEGDSELIVGLVVASSTGTRGPPKYVTNSEHHQLTPSAFFKKEKDDELIPGVPNDLLLPGAIMVLAGVILVVFRRR